MTLEEAARNAILADERVSEAYARRLRDTQKILEGRLAEYYRQAKQTATVDAELARQNIGRLLQESGFDDTVTALFDEGYQEFLEGAHKFYKNAYGINLQYTDTTLENLNQLRAVAQQRFGDLEIGLQSILQDELVKLQFGATSFDIAEKQLVDIVNSFYGRYIYTYLNTATKDFGNAARNAQAEELGAEEYEYIGPLDDLTRLFCESVIDEIKSKEEWQEMTNDDGDPVWTHLGGWNCRHSLFPVISAKTIREAIE